ncbi:MAG: hypothetical protein FWG22_02280 [Prolixibacteraceae bacterium]|nr:hypothetical protein [Prolixibacteraceae bacterium]
MNANTNQNLNPGCAAAASIVGAFIGLALGLLLPYFLCDINPDINAGWFRGIWHGGNLPGNFILSFFDDRLLRAPLHTTAYTIFWWFSTVVSIIVWIIMCINIVAIFRKNLSGN